jgi:Protein of unknown function (DUF3738)
MRTARPFVQRSLAVVKATIRIAAVALILHCPLSQAEAQAQAPGQLPEFEVMSIKPNRTNERMYYGLRNASLTVRNMTVKGLIQIAYGKRDFQINGGPAWITSECFDVAAKAERPQRATHDMLKSLLARVRFIAGQLWYVIINLLSNMLGRAVINNTGLTGKYAVNLQPVPDSLQLQTDPADPLAQADVSLAIIEAVERQLGLKIESIKGPEEVLVIDHIERPSAN